MTSPKKVIEQLSVESGVAVTGEIKVLLKGGSRKEYILKLVAGHGFTGMEQKWKLLLESPEQAKVCVDGKLLMPSVSSEQKQISMRSISTKVCEETTRMVEEVKEKLRQLTRETPEFIPMEKELERLTEEKIGYCSQQLKELSTLDSVKLNIEYTRMPTWVREYSKVMDVALKTVLLPYMTGYETRESHNEIIVDLKFVPHLKTVNMVLTTEMGTTKYHNIRIP